MSNVFLIFVMQRSVFYVMNKKLVSSFVKVTKPKGCSKGKDGTLHPRQWAGTERHSLFFKAGPGMTRSKRLYQKGAFTKVKAPFWERIFYCIPPQDIGESGGLSHCRRSVKMDGRQPRPMKSFQDAGPVLPAVVAAFSPRMSLITSRRRRR